MIKQQITDKLKQAVKDSGFEPTDAVVSIAINPTFGDYSSNIALQLAKQNSEKGKQSSVDIAKDLAEHLKSSDYTVQIAAPGFINFSVKPEILASDLAEILKNPKNYGQNTSGKSKKIQVEFVSANPTGPLTLANGRGAAIGDTLAKVLDLSGYQVEREYYNNDTGNQVRLLGQSIQSAGGKADNQDNFYQGEYIKDLADIFKDQLDLEPLELGHKAADYLMEHEIKPALERFGLKFDHYFSERSLYEQNLVQKALVEVEKSGVTYEKDGAVWFKTTDFGDDKDRVLMTSEAERGRAEPTYFLADIAYHLDVVGRGFDKKINIWGADHHSYVQRMSSAMEGLGKQGWLEIILTQMVRLFKEGKEVKMSKRAGNFVTLDELLAEVSVDAARFFFLMYSPDTSINFNLDLAKKQSSDNPVYYVQYAHARMWGIQHKSEAEIPVSEQHLGLLIHPKETALIKDLLEFPDLVQRIAQDYQVQQLTAYALGLAEKFHHFYEACPVVSAESEQLKSARMTLVQASQIVLKSTLQLMGISAPERM